MKILMVLTSHDTLGNTGRKTGFWLEELAAPYYVFKDAGVEIVLASPRGGQPPLDPKSNEPGFQTDLTRRFNADAAANSQLVATVRLDSVRQEDFDTVFYPGGHGPMWDLAEDEHSIKLIESFVAAGKPIGIVCHSTGALHRVKTPGGEFLVQGKEVTGFTNGEEEEMKLTKVVPFLVEDEMLKRGAIFSKKADWAVHVVSDGLLITGQNPASSGPAAKTLMAAVQQKATPAPAGMSGSQTQVEQKTYQMPPKDGFTIAHFLTVADIERSARFYETVFGGRILSRGDSSGAPGYIQIANTWLIVNVGGGPTPDKPAVILSTPSDPNLVNSFINIRVADIQECYKIWQRRGADFITEPKDKYGETRCYIRDPDGYIIEVGQSKPGVTYG